MRTRERILQSLESVYRSAFEAAQGKGNQERMDVLDLEYQREQLRLELLLDIRDLLQAPEEGKSGSPGSSLLDKAQAIRRLTRLR
ncbi:MAG: hypothetical protein OEZ65_12375 [Gemmatimonadota bacterium]|nr:hypothetical protein [Gemmatimonadota bacterium]MDH5760376.1 hypothetical protein [Gemmatimonadota bacterium]